MGLLKLVLACRDYDRVIPLQDGRVQPEGIDLNLLTMEPEELFWRMLKDEEFDASEFSLGAYMILQGQKDRRFVAIPVFPSRMFRHACVFVNRSNGINKPGDLKGKRIGIPDPTMTAVIWLRGIFAEEYGVQLNDVHWFTGGMNQPGRKARIELPPVPGVRMDRISDDQTLNELLAAGEIDAIMTSRAPTCFLEGLPQIERLWPDFRAEEKRYFQKTGIFPIMHLVVIRREVYEENPWVALSLFKAFCQAKDICIQDLMNTTSLKYTIPWYLSEVEETIALMGKDYWPYGLEPNRKVLETALRYAYQQGLIPEEMDPAKLFAPSTLDLYKI